MLELLERVKVGAIVAPDVDPDSDLRQAIAARAAQLDIPMHYITENTDLPLGKAEITLYAPVTGGGDSNEQCLSVLCQANGWEALLTGDMPLETEELLVAREDLPQVDLWWLTTTGPNTPPAKPCWPPWTQTPWPSPWGTTTTATPPGDPGPDPGPGGGGLPHRLRGAHHLHSPRGEES